MKSIYNTLLRALDLYKNADYEWAEEYLPRLTAEELDAPYAQGGAGDTRRQIWEKLRQERVEWLQAREAVEKYKTVFE